MRGVIEKMDWNIYSNSEESGYFSKRVWSSSDGNEVTVIFIDFKKNEHEFKDFMFKIVGMEFDIYADFRLGKNVKDDLKKGVTRNNVWLTIDKLYKIEIHT